MNSDGAFKALAIALTADPLATVVLCTSELVRIRRFDPQLLPAAMTLFAAIATAAAGTSKEIIVRE